MIVLIDSMALIVLLLGWWLAIAGYPRLPETIPVHFGFSGEADGWGRRGMIFLLPAISTVITAFDYLLYNGILRQSRTPVAMGLPPHLLLLELVALFTYITWRTSEVAFGRARGLGRGFLPVVMLAILGTSAWMIIAGKDH